MQAVKAEKQPSKPNSKAMQWGGIISSGLAAFMLTASGVMKIALANGAIPGDEAAKGMAQMGLPQGLLMPLAILELSCVAIYLVPRLSVLGAILITGYLGGAIATHVRVGDTNIIGPLLPALLAWLGIYLREARLRALLPVRRTNEE